MSAKQIVSDVVKKAENIEKPTTDDIFNYTFAELPAQLRAWDIGRAIALSLVLSFVVTIFPARRAARMNPVEALRYE